MRSLLLWRHTMYLMLLSCITTAHAQEKYNTEVPKDIIILRSTKDYSTALRVAKEAAGRLHKKLDLRGLKPDPKIGLTMSKADCYGSGGGDDLGYPCYPARGDGSAFNDDYISVEFADAYKGFTKGYYMVVAAITAVKSVSMKAKRSWPVLKRYILMPMPSEPTFGLAACIKL